MTEDRKRDEGGGRDEAGADRPRDRPAAGADPGGPGGMGGAGAGTAGSDRPPGGHSPVEEDEE